MFLFQNILQLLCFLKPLNTIVQQVDPGVRTVEPINSLHNYICVELMFYTNLTRVDVDPCIVSFTVLSAL